MNKLTTVETDGNVYLVQGNDGRTYKCFLTRDKATRHITRLVEQFGDGFYLDIHKIDLADGQVLISVT